MSVQKFWKSVGHLTISLVQRDYWLGEGDRNWTFSVLIRLGWKLTTLLIDVHILKKNGVANILNNSKIGRKPETKMVGIAEVTDRSR